jgi:type II secretory pathway pseudopilin PulG
MMKKSSLKSDAPQLNAPCAEIISSCSPQATHRRGEQGYTLVALLALMSIMALLLVAAVPNVRLQAQRSLEEEAIWRGEEVAEAIRLYTRLRGTLPTSIDQLLEGVPARTKKIQVLRPVAAHDPLSSSGEWKLIRRTDPAFIDFQRAVMAYAGRQPPTRDTAFMSVAGQLPPLTNVLDTGTTEAAPGGEDDSSNTTGPFIGVASRSRRDSIINYYGIPRHDKWVFTPYFR